MDLSFLGKSKWIVGTIVSLVLFSCVATVTPYLVARMKAGVEWSGVTPTLSYDALRYYARANDVTRGNIYPHDPYFFEHRDMPSPTPSLDDVLVAAPQMLGLSFNTSYYLSIFFWCLMFLLLSVYLFFQVGVSLPLRVLGAFWLYLGVYNDMLRPGAMQIVFPLFLVFLILLYRFLCQYRQSTYLLGMIAGLSMYFYIYLSMVIFATLGVCALLFLANKRSDEIKQLMAAAMIGVVLMIPHLLNVSHLSALPYYQETMTRIVFIYSHWPQPEAYYYGRWVFLGMLIVYGLRKYFPKEINERLATFLLAIGGGTLVAMVSNIILGRDFDIAVHVARFGIVWYLLLGVILIMPVVRTLKTTYEAYAKKLAIVGMCSLLVMQMLLNIPRAMTVFSLDAQDVAEIQMYRGTINWLAGQQEGVVLASEKMMTYVPSLVKHYVLFSTQGTLFLLSGKELEERYLLAHAFDHLTLAQFINDRVKYDGPAADRSAQASSLRHRLCAVFLGKEKCGPEQKEEDFVDVDALRAEYESYYPGIEGRILSEYKRYHVRYVVFRQGEHLPAVIDAACSLAYHDQYFSVCTLPVD